MHVRRLAPHEVTLHRELRLRALQDAPDSFGESPVDTAAQPVAYWERLTRAVTGSADQVMFLACEGGDVIGVAYGLVDRERDDMGRLGGMWVDPAWRRRGVGRVLLQEVVGWARSCGFRRLGVWAPTQSPAAAALYSRAGFRATGARRPVPSNPTLSIVAMEADL